MLVNTALKPHMTESLYSLKWCPVLFLQLDFKSISDYSLPPLSRERKHR